MLKRFRAQILTSLILLLAAGGSAEAQAFGRMTVVVRDEAGQLLKGVKVTVTCAENSRYREEIETNKKGKAVVSVTDATKVYSFHFEYGDLQPVDLDVEPEIQGNVTKEVTMAEGRLVAAETETGTVTFTPAEKIYNDGVAALKAGDFATAKTHFLAALEKDKKMAQASAALAGLYLEGKDYQAALTEIERYMKIDPGNPNALFMLYDAHNGLGNQKEADAALEALKKADKGGDTVALIYNAGVAAVKIGNYTTGQARFLEALEIDPTLKEAVGALSVIYHRQGKYQEAVDYADKHLALDPGNPRAHRVRWDAYQKLGDKEKADAAFKELAAADPQVLAVELYNQGNDLFEAGNTAGAVAAFERVIDINPDNALAHYRLGVSLVGSDSGRAKEHLQKFIDLDPDNPEAAVAKDMMGYLE